MQLHPSDKPIGATFTELQSVDSTNNYALRSIHEGLAYHGDCFFAFEQSSGKGQRGKTWNSARGENIILSVILQPSFLRPQEQFFLSACVALATHEFFNYYTQGNCRIKWPNDLYWKDSKAGGILVENIIGKEKKLVDSRESIVDSDPGITSIRWSVAGIGININQENFPEELYNPVSLKQITNKNFDPVTLAKELCHSLENYYQLLIHRDFANILDRYNQVLYKKNEKIKLKKGNIVFDATIKSVNEQGQLVVEDAIEEAYNFGEIEFVRSQ